MSNSNVNPPIDPTQNDISPQELIQSLPTRTARRRVLQAAEIPIDVDNKNFESLLRELSEIELRRAVSELRFAGKPTVYYYWVSELHQLSSDDALGQDNNTTSSGAYGPYVEATIRDHSRVYIVCKVPETGSQTQLTPTDRDTTIATFKPRAQFISVRAPDDSSADATIQAVVNYLDLDDTTRISFLNAGFRGRFEDSCVDGYSTLRLRDMDPQDSSREIEVRSEDTKAGSVADVRDDAIVEELLQRGDTELNAATGLITVSTGVRSVEHDEALHPRVTIGFPDGLVTFEQFVPEQVLIEFDDLVRDSL